MKPRRVQRSRRRGYRMPPNTVYVGRPTVFGNPFVGDRAACVEAYRRWVHDFAQTVRVGSDEPVTSIDWRLFDQANRRRVLNRLHQIRGRDLACWCPLDEPCHADVLLELANAED